MTQHTFPFATLPTWQAETEATGEELAARGIQQSSDNAEAHSDGWNAKALEFVRAYPRPEFMTEDIRQYAYALGLDRPPSERAWGSVMRAAVAERLITRVGFKPVTNPKAHQTPATLWRKCVNE